MNTYLVEFYYNTDLRWDKRVSASSALHAFAIAETQASFYEWCSDENFCIKVRRVS